MKKRKERARKGPNVRRFILNCKEAEDTGRDWGFDAAVSAQVIDRRAPRAKEKDLRASWWKIRSQGTTGACVGFATADGVLRRQYVDAGWIDLADLPSPRFIWMANKETDDFTSYPTTFIEQAGTQTKLALGVARNYGCVLEDVLPMTGGLSSLDLPSFYTLAARLRIASYHSLQGNLDNWRTWIDQNGPILTRLNVDSTWDRATETGGVLKTYKGQGRGGHAVSLVGYTEDYFIVRNSWGTGWGDKGFAYAMNDYAEAAFQEAYGAVL